MKAATASLRHRFPALPLKAREGETFSLSLIPGIVLCSARLGRIIFLDPSRFSPKQFT
jgi:hypothetical protein